MNAQGKVVPLHYDELDDPSWLERLEFPHVLIDKDVCITGVIYLNTSAPDGSGTLWDVFRESDHVRISVASGQASSVAGAQLEVVRAMRTWRDVMEARFTIQPKQPA